MVHLFRSLIVSVVAFVSFLGFVLAIKADNTSWSVWEVLLLVLAFGLGCFSVYLDIKEYRSRPWRVLKDKQAIRNYMYDWIKNAGAVAIFSRDLSWVEDRGMERLLGEKAASGELTIVIPKPVPVSERLAAQGAQVLCYSDTWHVIRSRFTIINAGRTDSRVAIGRSKGSKHIVEEFSAGEHPAFHLAEDMLEFISRSQRAQNG